MIYDDPVGHCSVSLFLLLILSVFAQCFQKPQTVLELLWKFSEVFNTSRKFQTVLRTIRQFPEMSNGSRKCWKLLWSLKHLLQLYYWLFYHSFYTGILYRFVKKRELFFVTESELKPCDTMVGKLIYWFIKWFSSCLKHGCLNIYEVLMYSGRCSCITQPGASSENSVYYN